MDNTHQYLILFYSELRKRGLSGCRKNVRILGRFFDNPHKAGLNGKTTESNAGRDYSKGRQILHLAGYFYGFIRQIFNNGLGFVYRLNLQIVFSNRDDIVGA